MGWRTLKRENTGHGDPTRNTPGITGTGDEREENTNDRKGRNPA